MNTSVANFRFVLALLFGLVAGQVAAEKAKISNSGDGFAIVRAAAYKSSKRLAKLKNGTIVEIVRKNRTYSEIRFYTKKGPRQGWVWGGHVVTPRPTAVVLRPEGLTAIRKENYPERAVDRLARGTVLDVRKRFGAATEVGYTTDGRHVVGVVPQHDLGSCVLDRFAIEKIQRCLNAKGFDVGTADGVSGPRTRRAISAFFKQASIDQTALSTECQQKLICDVPNLRNGVQKSEDGEAALDLRYEAALDDALIPEVLKLRRKKAQEAYAKLNCSYLAKLPPIELGSLSVEACEAKRARSEREQQLKTALAAVDCETVRTLVEELETPSTALVACEQQRELARLAKQRENALAALDCETVGALDQKLADKPRLAQCEWDKLLALGTQDDLLAAVDERIKADTRTAIKDAEKLLEVFKQRFPDSTAMEAADKQLKTIADRRRWQQRLTESQKVYATLKRVKLRTSSRPLLRKGNRNLQMQHALSLIGYKFGSIDGKIGPKTREALRQFQNEYGFRRSSSITAKQLALLMTFVDRLDLAYSVHRLPKTPYEGKIGQVHDTLLPVCRLSRKSQFGRGGDAQQECGYITKQGHWAIPPVFDSTHEFRGEYALVSSTYKGSYRYWIIDRAGVFVDPAGYHSASDRMQQNERGVCPAKAQCGVLALDSKTWLIEPRYDFTSPIDGRWYLVREGGKEKMVSVSGKEFSRDYLGSTVISIGSQYATSKKDVITIFKTNEDDDKAFQLKYRGYLGQDCKGRLLVNDPEGKTSWIYKRAEKSFLSVPGTFDWVNRQAKTCRDTIIVSRQDGRESLLNLKENKIFKSFDGLEAKSSALPYLIAERKLSDTVSRYGIIDWDGNWIVPAKFQSLDFGADGYFVGTDSDFSVVGFRLEKTDNETWSIRDETRSRGQWATPLQFNPGFFQVSYGNEHRFVGGDYIAAPDGQMLPRTARRELGLFQEACETVIDNNNNDVTKLRMACEKYIAMRANKSKTNPTPSARAMLSYAYARANQGYSDDARKWIFKAANAGSVNAQTELGNLYSKGNAAIGITRSNSQAAKWLMRAATNGNEFAQFNLSLMFFDGRYFKRDYSRAYYWAKRSAAQGNPDARHNKRVLEDYFAALSASQRRRSRSLTLGDVLRGFSKFMPSDQEIAVQRSQRAAEKQCKASVRTCYASCEGKERTSDRINFGIGDNAYEACRRQCGRINC